MSQRGSSSCRTSPLVLGFLATVACSGEPINLGGSPPESMELASLEVSGVVPVLELNTDGKEDNVTLTGDQLELCFTSQREGGTGDVDVYCAARAALTESFGEPIEATLVNTSGFETSAALDLDGLSLWVGSDRDGGMGGVDIWRSDRPDRASLWQAPVPEVALNSAQDDIPRPPGWGRSVMPMASRRDLGVYSTYFAQRNAGVFSPPVLLEELAEPDRAVVDGFLTQDGRMLLYVLPVDGNGQDIFYSVRASTDEPFGAPIPLVGANGPGDDRDPWLSPDGGAFYFVSERAGSFDIYRADATLTDAATPTD